jgi:site-specific DNA-methyltransferase (adenine-specific)
MLARVPQFSLNTPQRGDSLALLRSLADSSVAMVNFDPQHRGVLDHLKFGNEGARQRGRSLLPAMTDEYIDECLREATRVLAPSGNVILWADTFQVGQDSHLRVADALSCVDVLAWDSLRMGMGKRSRRRGDYVLILQRPPITAKNWTDHSIPSRWAEKVDRKIHPHIKLRGLLTRLIAATTKVGDVVVDPCAGSFLVLDICQELGRDFVGVDIAYVDGALA